MVGCHFNPFSSTKGGSSSAGWLVIWGGMQLLSPRCTHADRQQWAGPSICIACSPSPTTLVLVDCDCLQIYLKPSCKGFSAVFFGGRVRCSSAGEINPIPMSNASHKRSPASSVTRRRLVPLSRSPAMHSRFNESRRTKSPPGHSNWQGFSVAFCSPAKGLTFSGLMENPLVGKKLKS